MTTEKKSPADVPVETEEQRAQREAEEQEIHEQEGQFPPPEQAVTDEETEVRKDGGIASFGAEHAAADVPREHGA